MNYWYFADIYTRSIYLDLDFSMYMMMIMSFRRRHAEKIEHNKSCSWREMIKYDSSWRRNAIPVIPGEDSEIYAYNPDAAFSITGVSWALIYFILLCSLLFRI